MSTDKDQVHVIGGLKAAISNPSTSDQAKERAKERLQELGERDPSSSPEPPHQELGSHQIAGYKDPTTSDEKKQRAREAPDEVVAEGEKVETRAKHSPSAPHHDEHTKRVLAGYKAALHNANVSDEAKQRARDVLREHGEAV